MDFGKLFSYEPNTGLVRWKVRPIDQFVNPSVCLGWNKRYAGTVAGCNRIINGQDKGIWIGIKGKFFAAHNIAWTITNGAVPSGYLVDHIDRVPSNNKIENLRLASVAENGRNRSVGVGLFQGVSMDKQKRHWVARIMIDGRAIWIGTYPTRGMAALARAKATMRYHGRFSYFLSW